MVFVLAWSVARFKTSTVKIFFEYCVPNQNSVQGLLRGRGLQEVYKYGEAARGRCDTKALSCILRLSSLEGGIRHSITRNGEARLAELEHYEGRG